MRFDLKNKGKRKEAISKFKKCLDGNKAINLSEMQDDQDKDQSDRQRSYLYIIFGYFATESGYPKEYVKEVFYKIECNCDIFVNGDSIRSIGDLSMRELSITIERFLNWSVLKADILLPDPKHKEFIEHCETETNKYQNRIYI